MPALSDYSDYLKPGKVSHVWENKLLVKHCINIHSNYCEYTDLMLFCCDIMNKLHYWHNSYANSYIGSQMRFINVLFKRLLFCGGNLHFNSIFVFVHVLLQWCTRITVYVLQPFESFHNN